jgi:hypothetical protein
MGEPPMRRLVLMALLLPGCVAPPDGPPQPLRRVGPERAAELECIRQGEIAERQQPWFGANNPRNAVIGARVRNDCLDFYRRGGAVPPASFE